MGYPFAKFYHLFCLAPGHPGNVQLLRISFSQLRLTWQTPADPNGNITGYKVTWKMVSDDKLQSVDGKVNETILASENTSYVINYLGERCKFKVKWLKH